VEGRSKTRLSPALPPALASELYRGMLSDALRVARAANVDQRFLYWADPHDADERIDTRVQKGGSLGERLESAFAELLFGGALAAIVGADCPDLSAAHLEAAFAQLEHRDLVLGPALDGGYWLIALRAPAPELFRGIEWSSAAVLDQTLARASALGLSLARLETLTDLDTPADLASWIARASIAPPEGAPRTVRALRRLGLLPEAATSGRPEAARASNP
jgi:rSAM/selenodomain-associated transferase 1